MNKKFIFTVLLSGFVLLTGCECKHKEWTEATCSSPKTCVKCGVTEGEALEHKWEDATCEKLKTCSVCGTTEGELAEHKWEDATCEKLKTCSVCGETEGELAEHKWKDATCEKPKTCSVCGETEGELAEHKWEDADCETPKTCSVCDKTDETDFVYKEHQWKDATYDAPKTCSVCGKTEGKALEKPPLLITFTDAIPSEYSYYYSSGVIRNTVRLTDVSYVAEKSYDGSYTVRIYFSGEKTYDKDGVNQSSSASIGYKIYDSEGYVVDDDTFYTPSLNVGEQFRDEEEIIWDLDAGEYTIDFSNTN